VFPDIKTYFDFDNTNKTCQLCNDGRPLKTYTKCDGCQKFFCLKHRPMFQQQWFCPFCEESFKAYLAPLKQSNIQEFFKKMF